MAGAKETPRQKMIGMMYLFYTALLALNISADILNAFILVNDSMGQTNKNFGAKNGLIMDAFQKQLNNNKEKVKPFYNNAILAQQYSDELVDYIYNLQDTIIIHTEGYKAEDTENFTKFDFKAIDPITKEEIDTSFDRAYKIPGRFIKKKDNYNSPMDILIPEIGTKAAITLKKKFQEYNKKMKNLIKPADTTKIQFGLNTDAVFNPKTKIDEKWEHYQFYHTILMADLVILNKYVSEVLNTESEILAKLYSYIDEGTIKFDAVTAAVIPKSNVVVSGSDYTADIFVAAYSKTEKPIVRLLMGKDSVTVSQIEAAEKNEDPNFVKVDSVDNGRVYFPRKTSASGEFKYAGFISVKGPDGKYQHRPFSQSYQVIQPSANVSADKMNAVFRGLNNPMTISAAGFTNDRIKVSASGGSLSANGNGQYVFRPGKGKQAIFSVTGLKDDGSTVSLARKEFRIKGVPSPIIKLANTMQGKINKELIKSQPYLVAVMDNFLFDLKYTVSKFDIQVFSPSGKLVVRESVRGAKISSKSISKIMKAPRGSTIIILNVRVKGPDGEKSAIGPTLKLK